MDTVGLTQYALATAFGILGDVASDLTPEQCDWLPPGIANPIGALYWHTVSGADEVVFTWCSGQAPLYQRAGWKEKVLLASLPEDEGDPLAQMRAIRVDLPALHEYRLAVAQACQEWLTTLSPEDLERKLQTPIGEYSVAQTLSTIVIWHIDAHCGEIAALKGCQGAKGYPF